MKTVDADQIPCEIHFNYFSLICADCLFVKKTKRTKNRSSHRSTSNFSRIIFPPLAASRSSPADGAKTHAFVCQTTLNLRGRSSVSTCSLLFCCDAGLIQTVRNVVSVNIKIQFLNQVSKSL